ncbi:XrtA/PEP-CTERM system TPR-repeat protein PrsT [Undibacterium sp. SXout20W]|uniref:XrtA/PEP-CTERM system TPR-repeat protein PrsT n=1 Tax=Undibacterium sp. SXout20W TaxID=3413051 RepID=UPI003BF23274
MSPLKINPSRIRLTLSVLFLCTELVACTRFYSADKFVEEAKSYIAKGDEKSALIQLKNALQKDPNHKEARILMGDIYLETEDGLSAENEFRKAIGVGAPKDQIQTRLAKSLLLEGKFKKLLEETEVPVNSPISAEVLAMRGEAYLNLKDKDSAKKAFDQALKVSPNNAAALIGLAKMAATDNNLNAANEYANLATTNNAKDSKAWLFKGQLLAAQSDTSGAISCFDTALKLHPKDVAAHIEKANIEIKLKQFDQAQADIKAATDLRPQNPNAMFSQAVLYLSQGKNQESLNALAPILKNAPQYLPAILISGIANFSLGSTKQSEVIFNKYLAEVPSNLYVQKLLAQSQLNNGKAQLALENVEKIIAAGNEKDSELLALAGDASLAAKEFNKANSYYEKAVAIKPENASYLTQMAISKLNLGKQTDAISELEKAITLGDKTSSLKSGVLLAMTYVGSNQFDQAMTTVQALEKQQASNPLLLNLKGIIYLKKNDVTNARISFNDALKAQANYFPAIANLAKLDIGDKKYDQAKERYQTLLNTDKKNLDAELALADLANIQGNKKDVEKWLQQAYNDHPDQASAAGNLINFYIKSNEIQKALTLARNAHNTAPESAEFLQLLANTQQLAKDWTGAIDSLSRLASLHPESPDEKFQLAGAYVNAKDQENAIETLKKILVLQPTYTKAAIALADLESRKADFNSSLQIAKQLQKQDAKNPQGFILEGDILSRQSKYAPALKSYEAALQLQENNLILKKIHLALVKDKKEKEANDRVNNWLAKHPADNNTRNYYAEYLLGQPQSRSQAISQFLIVLKAEPNNPIVLNNLAWAYDQDKNPVALSYAEKAYQLAGDTPQILDTYGWILAEKGEYQKALPILQKADKLKPSDNEIQAHLASVKSKTGDTPSSVK